MISLWRYHLYQWHCTCRPCIFYFESWQYKILQHWNYFKPDGSMYCYQPLSLRTNCLPQYFPHKSRRSHHPRSEFHHDLVLRSWCNLNVITQVWFCWLLHFHTRIIGHCSLHCRLNCWIESDPQVCYHYSCRYPFFWNLKFSRVMHLLKCCYQGDFFVSRTPCYFQLFQKQLQSILHLMLN